MIRLYQDRTIKMSSGDNGVIAISLNNYKLKNNDKFDMFVYDNADKVILEKNVSYFENGLAYLDFKKEDTININRGVYKYMFFVKLETTEEFKYLDGLNFIIE